MFMAWLESVSSKVIVGQSMGVIYVRKLKHFESKRISSKHHISKSSRDKKTASHDCILNCPKRSENCIFFLTYVL